MDESLTDKGSEDTGVSNDALPEDQNNTSADEQNDSVSSNDTQEPDQSTTNQPENQTTGEEDSSSDDDGLAKFAKSQGYNPDELTDGERKALKLAHDNQKAYRQSQQKKSEELTSAVSDVNNVTDDELDNLDPTDARIARIEANQRIQDQKLRASAFYENNPEARQFDKEMGEVILEEVAKYTNPEEGKAAGRFLARDLDRLLVLAKAKKGNSTEDARKQGAREEREKLRKQQEGSADGLQATQPASGKNKVSREDISNMSDDEYMEFRDSGGLQEAISRGDLY